MNRIVAFIGSAALIAFSIPLTIISAPSENSRMYGANAPFTIDDLPLSNLRTDINSLPGHAKAKGLRWLHGIDFPAADVEFLRVDLRGGIFYEDPIIEGAEAEESSSSTPVLSEITDAETFTLHSKPGASRTVYLDMDGHVVTGTIWNNNNGCETLYMRPYDTDGDESYFNSAELEDIAETWKRVAEDYAAFDIDVTTENRRLSDPRWGISWFLPERCQRKQHLRQSRRWRRLYFGVGLEQFYLPPARLGISRISPRTRTTVHDPFLSFEYEFN